MSASYNRVAGQNLERLGALSDGVFAVAMTLLVLDLRVPLAAAVHSERDLAVALGTLGPRLVPYFMTFVTLGLYWVGQATQFNSFVRADRNLSWIHIAFLLCVSLTPFSTALLASFLTYRLALIAYWFDIFLLGMTLLWSWRYAVVRGLIRDDVTSDTRAAMQRRIIGAQALYAVAMALCVVNTYWSVGLFIALQLNYAFGVRWPGRLAH